MRLITFISLLLLTEIDVSISARNYNKFCGLNEFRDPEGNIHSPNYPENYPNFTSCTWAIITPPNSRVTISMLDFDIEKDPECDEYDCCTHNWLSIPQDTGKKFQHYCGNKIPFISKVLSQGRINIKFLITHFKHGGRGFKLQYRVDKSLIGMNLLNCKPGDVSCGPNGCIPVLFAKVLCQPWVCKEGQLKCKGQDWGCYNETERCDGVKNCLSGWDEMNCSFGNDECPAGYASCGPDLGCYSNTTQKCNGIKDCLSGADEKNCPPICPPGFVTCGPHSNECYHNVTERCNGISDCLSGVDEDNCRVCLRDEMMCDSGTGCYKRSQICDGNVNCSDFSDEINCDFCPKNEALCSLASGKCFTPSLELCDGKFDCPHGEDEIGCVYNCPNEIACADHNGCYPKSGRCNGIQNCLDGSDEENCPQRSFMCRNGFIISEQDLCNGVNDCSDGSDEEDCVRNSVISTAIIGSLTCGLLLVVAIGCTCRLYSYRLSSMNTYRFHQRQQDLDELTPQPVVVSEFYHQEPPPAYTVACQQSRMFPSESRDQRRSGRRPHCRQEASSPPYSVSVLPAPTGVPILDAEGKPIETEAYVSEPAVRISSSSQSSPSTSTTGSPSRDSLTSSTSLLSYTSNNNDDDDTPLLVLN